VKPHELRELSFLAHHSFQLPSFTEESFRDLGRRKEEGGAGGLRSLTILRLNPCSLISLP